MLAADFFHLQQVFLWRASMIRGFLSPSTIHEVWGSSGPAEVWVGRFSARYSQWDTLCGSVCVYAPVCVCVCVHPAVITQLLHAGSFWVRSSHKPETSITLCLVWNTEGFIFRRSQGHIYMFLQAELTQQFHLFMFCSSFSEVRLWWCHSSSRTLHTCLWRWYYSTHDSWALMSPELYVCKNQNQPNVIDWLIDQSVGQLIRWSVDWWDVWLGDWFVGWLVQAEWTQIFSEKHQGRVETTGGGSSAVLPQQEVNN